VVSACKARLADANLRYMTLPEDIYSQRILQLAANMPRAERLPHPDATATAHSRLCGSRVTVDLSMQGDVVTDYGQSLKACLLRHF
jgi:NifU-like protein involved in Fe-S cluster formation